MNKTEEHIKEDNEKDYLPGELGKDGRNKISTDERARKYAQLAALGARTKHIKQALGLNKYSAVALHKIREDAYKKGYVQNLQEQTDANVIDIRQQMKELAETCIKTMNLTAEVIHTNLIDDLIVASETGKKVSVNLGEAKVIAEFLNSTEYSGKKAEPPVQIVDVKVDSEKAIEGHLNNVEKVLEKYLGKNVGEVSEGEHTKQN